MANDDRPTSPSTDSIPAEVPPPPPSPPAPPPPPPRRGGVTPGGVVRVDLSRIPGLDPWEVLVRAQRALRSEGMSKHSACFYLAELADGGYARLGHPSIGHCLRHRFTQSKRKLENLIAVGRALPGLPLLDQAWDEGRLCYTVVRHLIPILTPETQEAWIAWAAGRSEREVRRQTKRRQKGDLPTDPARRTIHGITHPIKAILSTTQYEVFWRAVEKLRAEYGQTLSIDKVLTLMGAGILTSAPDDKVPGRKPVKDRLFVLHTQPIRLDSDVRVVRGQDGELVPLDLEELREIEDILAQRAPGAVVGSLVSTARRVEAELSELDPRNSVPIVPEHLRDVPTPEAMRMQVMVRDGHRCRSCGSQTELTVHHCWMLSRGGRTVPDNLITLCATCHGSVHDGLTVILGDPEGEVQFVDRQGRLRDAVSLAGDAALGVDVERRSAAVAERNLDLELPVEGSPSVGGASSIEPIQLATLDQIPARVDRDWWARHRGLLSWNDRLGVLELRPGCVPTTVETVGPAPASLPEERRLSALVGQEAVRSRLATEVAAAQLAGSAVPHLLFVGEPGLGKSSLSRAVAAELGAPLVQLPASLVRGPEVLVSALADLPAQGVVFIDELHGLPRKSSEFLYEALDSGELTLPIRQGLAQRTIHLRLAPFTLIGATTDEDLLPRAFSSRLEVLRLTPYTKEELTVILRADAARRRVDITDEACQLLASAARDTPRRGLQLLRSVCNELAANGGGRADRERVQRIFERDGVDPDGRMALDRGYMALMESGQPLSLRTIAAKLGTSEHTVREVVEPFLLRRGWITITLRGRSRAA